MPRLKAAVIGVGTIGAHHLEGYVSAGATPVALCDPNPARLAEIADRFAVPRAACFADWRKLLSEGGFDTLSVCTPNRYHFDIAHAALSGGIPTLVEKPMTVTLDQARRLRNLARRKRSTAMVAFSHRFITQNIHARQLVLAGRIGRPYSIRVRYAHGGPYPGWGQSDWFYQPALAGGGALMDMGIHAIDMCHYLVGPITKVSAFVRTLRKPIRVDDNAVLAIEFAPALKCIGTIECGWTSGPGFNGIELHGDAGSITLELGKPAILTTISGRPGRRIARTRELAVPPGPTHWPNQMKCWVDYVTGRPVKVALPTIEDGHRSVAVAIAAMTASKTARTVTVAN